MRIPSILCAAPSRTVGAPAQVVQAPLVADCDTAVFGARGGTPITNAHTVLRQLWLALGHDRPPPVVVVYVEPFADRRVGLAEPYASGSTMNPFGHTAVAYTGADGQLTVMNIVGESKPALVNFIPLEEYLFGTTGWDAGVEQGGIYNRTFRLLALWDVGDTQVAAMEAYFRQLNVDAQAGRAVYNMNLSRVLNGVGKVMPWLPHYGNCASFSADGLREAGLLRRTTMWPKNVLVQAWRRNADQHPHLVTFERVPHAPLAYGSGPMTGSPISPKIQDWVAGVSNWDLTDKSDAVVRVLPGEEAAQVITAERRTEVPLITEVTQAPRGVLPPPES